MSHTSPTHDEGKTQILLNYKKLLLIVPYFGRGLEERL